VKRKAVSAVGGFAALTLLAAGPVMVVASGTAAAQNTAMTQDYTIGTGPVSNVTAVAQPGTAGVTADYTVGFTTPSALTAGTGTVTISDASGSTVFPSAASAYLMIDNTTASGIQPVTGATLSANGHSVTLSLPTSVGAGNQVSIYVIGATNPANAGKYSLDVATSANPQLASSGDFQISAPTSAPSFNPSAAPAEVGSPSTYTIGAFQASTALAAGSSLQFTSSAPAGTTDDVRFPTAVSDYKITDLTTAASMTPSAVSVTAAPSGTTGQTVTLQVPSALASGDWLSLTVYGVVNPSTTQQDDIIAAAPAVAATTSAKLQVGTSISNPTIAVSQTGAGATGVGYIVGFKLTAAIAGGGTVSLVAPPGTDFSSGTATLVDASHPAASANLSSSAITASPTSTSSTDNQLTVKVPNAISAGDLVYLEVNGVGNPPAGSYGGSAGNFTVATSADVVPADIPAYTIAAAPAPVTASIELSSSAPGALAQYSVADLRATAALSAGTGTIELQGPVGTVFPANTGDYSLSDVTSKAGAAPPESLSGGGTNDVVLHLGSNVASGNFFDVVASDVVNPPAGTYHLTVVGNVQAAVPPTAPPPPVVTTPPPVSAGYWLATRGGEVFGTGGAGAFGGMTVTSTTGPVVSIASTPDGRGYWEVTQNGYVQAFGDAHNYGDPPSEGVKPKDVIAMARTTNGQGYYLLGKDGGLFTFGNAKFHGSVPGLGKHVQDVMSMVATPNGAGYMFVGADGGVFTFGSAKFYGSLPGIGKHVHDVRAMLPASAGTGYVLVGADGGIFNFGTGVPFLGSLPGRGTNVEDIVGLALTSNDRGYWLAGSDGSVFAFGNAIAEAVPTGLGNHLPVVAIAGT
jgi:hypothetical protein